MRKAHVVLIPVFMLMVVGPNPVYGSPKEVTVNCSQGKSINNTINGLDNDSKDYIVHVSGACNENVMISDFQGNSLVLIGDPGATINGVSSSQPGTAVILVVSSRLVTIQNFTVNVTGSLPTGNTSGIDLAFCTQCNVDSVVINTPRSGLSTTDSTGAIIDLTVNMAGPAAGTALAAVNTSDLNVLGAQLHGPGGSAAAGTGLYLDANSHVRLGLSSATGTLLITGFTTGIFVRSTSHLDASTVCSGTTACGMITGNSQGLRLENGSAFVAGLAIDHNTLGGVFAATASTIEMTSPFSITNTSSGIGLSVSHNSHAALSNFGSTFTLSGNNPKQASIASLSSLQFNGGVTVNGIVNCDALSVITGTGSVNGAPVYGCPNQNANPTPLP